MQPESLPESPDLDRQRRRLRLLAALADARAMRARRRSLRTAQIRELVALRRRLAD